MIDPEKIKRENLELLRTWGVRVIDHLPAIGDETDFSPPSAQDVARRCIVINHVIGVGYGGDAEELSADLDEWDLMPYASGTERDMLARQLHSEEELADAQWMPESMQSFAWCLGLVELDPFSDCDNDLASKFPGPYADPSDFIATATLRPMEQIWRQADLHYRLHWAAVDAGFSGREAPVSLNVIRRRRKALDWVMGVEADWDEVPQDT